MIWIASLSAGLAVALTHRPDPPRAARTRGSSATATSTSSHVHLGLIAICATTAWVFGPGPWGPAYAVAAGGGAWWLLRRGDSDDDTAEAVAQLPGMTRLLGSALASGATIDQAINAVSHAVPGPAADRLSSAQRRLSMGIDPVTVWREASEDPALRPLGRVLQRAHESGAPIADAVLALADSLADDARAEAEDRARTVGVRAAVPLGICLLPAFLLLGIAPLVAGLVGNVVS